MNPTEQDDEDALNAAEYQRDLEEAYCMAQDALAEAEKRPLTDAEIVAIQFAGRIYPKLSVVPNH